MVISHLFGSEEEAEIGHIKNGGFTSGRDVEMCRGVVNGY
jgi:hypothetical protein